ncbi:MAG: hypothetical protein J6Y85_05640 [Alphaproteobacteria bacterium]|nr:hypothetical protein [Alphaproteobacteria bacterium]
MKKLSLIALILMTGVAQADFWSNCTTYGGTIITANKYGDDKGGLCNDPNDPNLTNNCNGKKFCVGENKMNWWSAFTWCEAIGGQLASFEHMCPGTQAIDNSPCPNLKGVTLKIWTSKGKGTDRGFALWSNADVGDERRHAVTVKTICEE